MKRILLATAAAAALAGAASAQEAVNVGIILGFTGPLESITPGMAASAELAFKEASDSGKLPGGITLNPVRANSTCIDAAAATTAATNLVTGENVAAIIGADCSGVTTAIANNVAVPNGVVMVSPSATSPALTDDRGRRLLLPHRALRRPPGRDPRRHREGEGHRHRRDHLHQQRLRQGPRRQPSPPPSRRSAAPSRSTPPHEDGKADYSAEVAALQASGADGAGGARLRRPGRRRHRPGLARHRRLRELLLRRRHVRPEPDRLDRRRDQRQGHRHPARRRGRGRRQVRRRWPRPPAWIRPAPTCPRATTPRR